MSQTLHLSQRSHGFPSLPAALEPERAEGGSPATGFTQAHTLEGGTPGRGQRLEG